MAKSHGFVKGDLRGNAGQFSFRSQGGMTIVSGRIVENKSAGDGATYAQRVQRCRLSNVINVFKVIREFERRAWQGKARNVSDYNMFVKKNLSLTDIYFPKEYAAMGAAVAAKYMVAQGQLNSVTGFIILNSYNVNISAGALVTDASTTVGALSSAIIANNVGYKNGDKITFGILKTQNITVASETLPGLSVEYIEFDLDTTSSALVYDTLKAGDLKVTATGDGKLKVNGASMASAAGAMVVHTREIEGRLLCSTQYIDLPSNSASNPYSNPVWIEQAAASYGFKPEALIQPNIQGIASGVYYTVNGMGGDNGYVTGSGVYAAGSNVTLYGQADEGYRVKGWYDNIEGEGEALSTSGSYTIENLSADTTVYCLFEAQAEGSVTISTNVSPAGGGSVTGAGSYAVGAQVTLRATPASGYTFTSWSNGSTVNPLIFNAATTVTLTATFTASGSEDPFGSGD